MKIVKLIAVLISLLLVSCEDKGITSQRLNGSENNLPTELKGLKVYSVSIGDGNYIKVAILNNEVNSTTYRKGKNLDKTTILLNNNQSRTIDVNNIVFENDSIIVCTK